MSNANTRLIVTLGVLLGALAGAAGASVLYGVMDANGFGHTIFRTRTMMLLVGVGTLPFFTLGGALAGGILARRFAPVLRTRTDSSSPLA